MGNALLKVDDRQECVHRIEAISLEESAALFVIV